MKNNIRVGLSREFTITDCTKSACDFFGVTRSRLLKRSVSMFLQPTEFKSFKRIFNSNGSSKNALCGIYRFNTDNKGSHLAFIFVTGKKLNIFPLDEFIYDETENRGKSVKRIVHDLNNIIMGIRACFFSFKLNEDGKGIPKQCEEIEANLIRAVDIIHDLYEIFPDK